MLRSKLSILVFFSIFAQVLSEIIDHSDDFYWRDYNGDVPKDALPGGMEKDHKQHTYIGQVVAQGVLVPGQVISGVKKIYFQGDYSARVETENIKIFCTKHPENFEWQKTNGNDVKLISRMRLIPGGFRYGEEIFIGRGIADNMLSVGKVSIPTDNTRSGYFKAAVEGDTYSPSEFEVLTYRYRSQASSSNILTSSVDLLLLIFFCIFAVTQL